MCYDLNIRFTKDFNHNFCVGCKKQECIQASKFIQVYNQLEKSLLLLKACPDEEPKKQGNTPPKPDLVYLNAVSNKQFVIEVKKLYHGFSSVKKEKDKEHALHNKYPKFQDAVSNILYQMADQNHLNMNLFKEYSITLLIKKYIKNGYFESEFSQEFRNFVNDFSLNQNNYIYENDLIKISFNRSYPSKTFGSDGIIFEIPSNYIEESHGILIEDLFNILNDYLTLFNEIIRLLEENKHKFDNYPDSKTIFLFIINVRMGFDLFQNFLPQNAIELFEGLASKKNEFTKYKFVESIYIFYEDFTEVYQDEFGQIANRTVDILFDLKEATKKIMLY